MKSTLVASIPAFVVIFALVFGFVTFYVVIQNAEATGGAACNYLEYNCAQEVEHASTACESDNVERCKMREPMHCRFVANFTVPANDPRNHFFYFNLS